MITFSFEPLALEKTQSELSVVIVDTNGRIRTSALRVLDQAMGGALFPALETTFSKKSRKTALIPTLGLLPTKQLLCLSFDSATATSDAYRQLGARMARELRQTRVNKVSLLLPSTVSLTRAADAEAFFEGIFLGSYQYHSYKNVEEGEQIALDMSYVICLGYKGARAQWQQLIEKAELLSEALCLTRTLVNTPPVDMHPVRLVEIAEEIAGRSPLCTFTRISAEQMETLGMHPTLAVGRGSAFPPAGAHLVYRPKGRARKRIAVIGKAVTFDSGGLSIKNADGMMTMKIDMAGAATVLGLFALLPALKLPIEVHGFFLAVENMPSGTAYRPGDVVKAFNGKTIEVLNTDAEGRLTLADALSYVAKEVKPDALIDLATLTGACVVALGEEIAGLFSNDATLSKALLKASEQAHEPICQLPLYAPYQDLIKSKVADLKNTGGRAAGAITAALFLSHFVEKIPWAHIDLAGPSYAEKETRPDQPFGGTGFGVRLLTRYLQALSRES